MESLKQKPIILLAFVAAAALLTGCATPVHFVRPSDWKDVFKRDSTIAYYKPALKDRTVFLDPGHGGGDTGSIGPSGDNHEADLNLRVALKLRKYLKKAGANVILSRETGKAVPLDARAQQANANDADIFVSIHHNAATNPHTNYTTTIYHSRPGRPGYKPSSRDLARYIQRDLSYVMGNPGPLVSFDGTMSDYRLYDGKGFAVLRNTDMTAALVECAFLSSAYEERRLEKEVFNDIQAWGIFRGIARYFEAGIPTLHYESDLVFSEGQPSIDIRVESSREIPDESIRVYIDGQEAGYGFNRKTGKIAINPPRTLSQGYHHLVAQARNSNGNSSAPFEMYFAVGNPPVTLRSSADPAMLPPGSGAYSSGAYSVITVTAIDSAGESVADGLPIRFRTSSGQDTIVILHNGVARARLWPGDLPRISFEAFNGPVKTEGIVTTSADAKYSRGLVISSDGRPVEGAEVELPGGKVVVTGEGGEYIIAGSRTDGLEVVVRADGYFGKREALSGASLQDPVILVPVARAVLHGKTFILDIKDTRDADEPGRIDVMSLGNLKYLLRVSGAEVVDLHREQRTLADALAALPEATVIHFGKTGRSRQITLRSNRLKSSRNLGIRMQRVFPQFTGVKLGGFVLRIPPSRERKNIRQVSITLPEPSSNGYGEHLLPVFSWNVAWAAYHSVLSVEGFSLAGSRRVEVRVQNKETGQPAAFVPVILNYSLRGMTDNEGICRFIGITGSDDDARVSNPEKYIVKGVTTELLR